jgi:hypothetical protein
MSVKLQKISGFLLFLVMKYVSETAEDQWFSPVPCHQTEHICGRFDTGIS